MYYDEFHNHKWARNLKHARLLLAENRLKRFTTVKICPAAMCTPGCA